MALVGVVGPGRWNSGCFIILERGVAPAERREGVRAGLDPEGDPAVVRVPPGPARAVGEGADPAWGRLEAEVDRGVIPEYEVGRVNWWVVALVLVMGACAGSVIPILV